MAVFTFAGCYAPSFKDCELTCAGTGADACPDGLTCTAGSCRLPGMTAACSVTPMIDAPTSCWPYTASNVDPCEAGFPPSIGPLSVTTMMTIDTNGPSHGEPYLAGRYIVLHVDSVNVAPGAVVAVTGLRPLIIVSDGDVEVTGIITVQPTFTSPMECSGEASASSSHTAAGGHGGGFGTGGGDGGGAANVVRSLAGPVNGDPTLVPLRSGCPGGRGGGTGPTQGTIGRGGGALQITTKTRISLMANGTIAAGGGGGGGGGHSTCAGIPCTGGGGGGGTGGSILLEGNRVQAGTQTRLCAVGGAGGNGPTTTPPIQPASSGSDATLCTGGQPGSVGIGAGRGADTAGSAGPNGGYATGTADSGAGGGGGLGRIRIHSIERADVLGTAIPVPAF